MLTGDIDALFGELERALRGPESGAARAEMDELAGESPFMSELEDEPPDLNDGADFEVIP